MIGVSFVHVDAKRGQGGFRLDQRNNEDGRKILLLSNCPDDQRNGAVAQGLDRKATRKIRKMSISHRCPLANRQGGSLKAGCSTAIFHRTQPYPISV